LISWLDILEITMVTDLQVSSSHSKMLSQR
jgi:hypothetical protein